LTEAGAKHTRTIQPGTLIISNSGATLGVPKITTITAGANDGIAMFIEPKGLSKEFMYFFLESKTDYFRNELAPGVGQPNLNTELLGDVAIPIPPMHEQIALANVLMEWGSAIEKTKQLITAKSRHLDWLREHSLARPGVATRTKLKSVTHESTARNGKYLGRDAIMAVTKSVGMRPMREETIAASIDRYKLVRPKAFAYNPMRLNIGSIAMSSFDRDVLVSPDYVVFECDKSKLLPGYLEHLRHTRLWGRHFEAAGSGGVRIRIYYDDLGAFAFPLPPLAQQLRVLVALDAAKAEIQTLESYLAALQQQKRGLMQKLLTGQWRIKPSSSKE